MRKVSLTCYPMPEQLERLRALSAATHVPYAVYVREGIDLVLAKLKTRVSNLSSPHAD